MSIPTESSRNIYCPPQGFGTRMVMIPSVRRPNNIFPINCPQPGASYPINAPVPYRIIRYNSPVQYQQIMSAHGIKTNLHGNENNTNIKTTKKSLLTNTSKNSDPKPAVDVRSEDPIDLSSTNLNNFSSSSKTYEIPKENEPQSDKSPLSQKPFVLKSPKKEPITPPSSQTEPDQREKEIEPEPEPPRAPRKRKSPFFTDENLLHKRELEGWVGHVKPVPGIPRQAGSKREEVLKAARSLFSKRTRTLYHWLYPSTSKNKLKATVSAAWDTLSNAEKEFYISQVLGRFGVPAGSLMVNPQLGGFKGLNNSSVPASLSTSGGSTGSLVDETGHAVTNLLLSEDDVSWASYPQAQAQEPSIRRRRRQTRSSLGENSGARQQVEEETMILKQIREESLEDDFADDPELSKEFEQFRWALHCSNNQEK